MAAAKPRSFPEYACLPGVPFPTRNPPFPLASHAAAAGQSRPSSPQLSARPPASLPNNPTTPAADILPASPPVPPPRRPRCYLPQAWAADSNANGTIATVDFWASQSAGSLGSYLGAGALGADGLYGAALVAPTTNGNYYLRAKAVNSYGNASYTAPLVMSVYGGDSHVAWGASPLSLFRAPFRRQGARPSLPYRFPRRPAPSAFEIVCR